MLKKLSLRLVCEEESTYHFGHDVRTERAIVQEQPVLNQGRTRIDWGRPLELGGGAYSLGCDAFLSESSQRNTLEVFIVEGEANRWPSYCRNFPVVVYPLEAQSHVEAKS